MSIFNPWVIAAIMALCIGSVMGGYHLGSQGQIAKQATTAQLIVDVREAAQQAAAKEIAKIKPRNITQRQILEHEIIKVPDYSKCNNSDDGLRAINGALGNTPITVGEGKLPGADPAH